MLHIELPEQLGEQVEETYKEAGYGSKSEFVRDAVRRRLEEVDRNGD